jgi:DNA polymerase III delta subunit
MKSSAGRSKAGSAGGDAPPATRARRGAPGAARAGERLASAALLERFDRGAFPSSLYLEGPSEPLKAALLAELRHAWAANVPQAPAARVFRAAESSVEEILGAFQGVSLFTPRDLIVVLEVEDLGRSEKRLDALAHGLATPAGESCLVLVESEGDTPRKSLEPLRAACAARWTADPPGRAELLAWSRRRLAREGVEAEAGVIEAVIDACEGEPLACLNELGKLTAYAAMSGRLTRDDVANVLRPLLGAGLPEYLGAVSIGSGALAAQRLSRLLASGVGEGAVLFALSNLVGGALGGWTRNPGLSAALRRRLSPGELARAMEALYRAEAAWKGGRADSIAVLEQATRALTS